jgi:hypothetical protein
MRRLATTVVGCLLTLPALAQEPKQPDDPTLRNLATAMQQVSVATEIYVADIRQRLAAKDARIAQWEAYFKAYIGTSP